MLGRLYISVLCLLAFFAVLVITVITATALHDSSIYANLPPDYRAAIERFEDGRYEGEMPDKELAAVLDMHLNWADEGFIPYWRCGEPVDRKLFESETIGFFRRFVPAWGGEVFQRYPIRVIALSMFSLLPLFMAGAGGLWITWLIGKSKTYGLLDTKPASGTFRTTPTRRRASNRPCHNQLHLF